MIFCMKCGKQLPDEAIFCKYCGASTEMNGGVEHCHSTDQTIFKPQTSKDNDVEDLLNNSKQDTIEQILNRHKDISDDQDDIYIDHEYHNGLARKNAGGTYNESLEIIEGGKWGFVNVSGKEVIPVVFDEVSIFMDGYTKVTLDGNCGILNKKGEEVIPIIYSDTTNISEGLVGVCMDGKWGFVDTKGKKVIPFVYSEVTPFQNGKAKVCKNGKWGVIDKKDRVISPFIKATPNLSHYENDLSKRKQTKEDEVGLFKSIYRYTADLSKAWAAFLGEIFLLIVVNHMLPDEKNSTYWSMLIITVVISLYLILIIIGNIRETRSRKD